MVSDVDGLMAHISCIRVQPQCSSISKALTLPLNGKLSLLSQSYTFLPSISERV